MNYRSGADGEVMERFTEAVFSLLLDHHRSHTIELELTLAQAQVLALLDRAAISSSRLATTLGISAPALTQLTDRLVRKGLIERQPSKQDRRAVVITLSQKGRRVADSFRQQRCEVFARALSHVESGYRSEALSAVAKLADAIEAHARLRDQSGLPAPASPRTAVTAPKASNDVGQAVERRPARRMRIEWD